MIALTESLVGIVPQRFAPDVPYRAFDLEDGVRHLQYLGVRYYAAHTRPVIEAADAHPELARLATAGPWRLYEVAEAGLIVPLSVEPIVFDVPGLSWDDGSASFTERAPKWDEQVLTKTGPDSWKRVSTEVFPNEEPLPPVEVSRIRQGPASFPFAWTESVNPC